MRSYQLDDLKMVLPARFKLATSLLRAKHSIIELWKHLVETEGIGPSLIVYQTIVLPLNYVSVKLTIQFLMCAFFGTGYGI